MEGRQVKKGVVLEELVVFVFLRRDEVALPTGMNIVLDGVLHCCYNFRVFTLDGDCETVRTAKTLVRFLQRENARGLIGQQVRKVCIQPKAGFNEYGECTECRKQEIER